MNKEGRVSNSFCFGRLFVPRRGGAFEADRRKRFGSGGDPGGTCGKSSAGTGRTGTAIVRPAPAIIPFSNIVKETKLRSQQGSTLE